MSELDRRREAEAKLPDFYTERTRLTYETFQRLFNSLGLGKEDRSTHRSITISSEEAPQELRGIQVSITNRPPSGRRTIVSDSVVLANMHHTDFDDHRPLTEPVASQVADYVDAQKERISKTAGGGFLGRMAAQTWLRNPS